MPHPVSIYTIGHSDHTTAAFIGLLHQYGITLVVDVRSQPYSRWASHFNRETLKRDLEEAGVEYRFFGESLGGRPSDSKLYTAAGPDYNRMEQTGAYQAGVDRLLDLAQAERAAVMCSEGDHRTCHRHLLLTQTLLKRGISVVHIRPNGTTVDGERIPEQLSLF